MDWGAPKSDKLCTLNKYVTLKKICYIQTETLTATPGLLNPQFILELF